MKLLIRVYSFSYLQSGAPIDPTGHGGGFVFDCRSLPNPGRLPEFREHTGAERSVRSWLASQSPVGVFLDRVYSLVLPAAAEYEQREFTDLSVAFGCTGGRHRSVYCAERMADRLREAGYEVRLVHWQADQDFPARSQPTGMILAAGFGTRLKPLTDETPKALISAAGRSMLEWTMDALSRAGVADLTVNTHHLPEQVHEELEHTPYALVFRNIYESPEREILGTGGGIRQAARWLHYPAPTLIHNVDVWSDFDLTRLTTEVKQGALVALACNEREASSYLLVDDTLQVCGLRRKSGDTVVRTPVGALRPVGFCGIHAVSHQLLEQMPKLPDFSIIDSYLKLISEGHLIRAVMYDGAWFDMGTPERLEALRNFLELREFGK